VYRNINSEGRGIILAESGETVGTGVNELPEDGRLGRRCCVLTASVLNDVGPNGVFCHLAGCTV
jgi:hypothetical protein